MTIERTVSSIPSAYVEEVISDFESEGCTAIKTQQPDGTWTVVATCPVNVE
jgi:hypothetical protein